MSVRTPLVSVVIPTYKRKEFLRRAVRSVLAQTYPHWELLIVENGDSVEGREVIEEMADPRIRYFSLREAGSVRARNLGIQQSAGEFIAFLDNDDEWLPEKLDRQIRAFEERPEAGMVTCEALLVNARGEAMGVRPKDRGAITLDRLLSEGNVICSFSSVVVRRRVFADVGLLNESRPIACDYEFHLRVAMRAAIHLVEEPLLRYTWHDDNMSRDTAALWKETADVLTSFAAACPERRALLDAGLSKCARGFYALASDAYAGRSYRAAATLMFHAVRMDPAIGVKIPWGTHSNLTRLVRPYVAGLHASLCALLHL